MADPLQELQDALDAYDAAPDQAWRSIRAKQGMEAVRAVLGESRQPRPPLPEGVEPVGWVDEHRAWVVRFGDVWATGWEVAWGYVGAWLPADENARGVLNDSDLVLARPAPSGEVVTPKDGGQ